MPVTNYIQTGGLTNITETQDAFRMFGPALDGPVVRKVYVTQATNSTVQVGQALFLCNSAVTAAVTGHLVVVEPFITASAVAASCFGFAAETCSGAAMIFCQIGGPGTIMVRGTGATASHSHGQMVAFNTASGYVVTAATLATTDAILWGRVAATGSVNCASAGTMASASTDTKTIEAWICRNVAYGGY